QSCCGAKLLKCKPYRFKQGVIHHYRLLQSQSVQCRRQRKHYMVVGAGQEVCFTLLYPCFSFMPLAFGTMPVAATIITDADVATSVAGIYMPAQGCRAALLNSPQCFLLMDGEAKR